MEVTFRNPLVIAADRYLEKKRCQLWAHVTIDQPEDRWDAATWLAPVVEGVLAELPAAVLVQMASDRVMDDGDEAA